MSQRSAVVWIAIGKGNCRAKSRGTELPDRQELFVWWLFHVVSQLSFFFLSSFSLDDFILSKKDESKNEISQASLKRLSESASSLQLDSQFSTLFQTP